ncbi:MAG: response regulator [Burkholderiales bacterium]|nr:response regulator [Burkholderiales bacterium]
MNDSSDQTRPLGPRIEVLVVDDQPDALRLLGRALTDAGLSVRTAASGEAALEAVRAHCPDAVLLDVQMGGINGFETCTQIRLMHEDLPIVFTTGLDETEDIVRGFEVGGTDYVTKPVSAPVVVARLMAHTRVWRMMRATREAVQALEVPMLAADAGRLLWLNRAARTLLQTCLPGVTLTDDAPLPAALQGLLQDGAEGEAIQIELGGVALQVDPVSEAGSTLRVVSLAVMGRAAPTAPASQPAASRLTARETEVLLWVARGKTNRDIAEILGMSPRTVNKHLEHVFEKLGVETRTAAAAAAQRLQLGV